MLIVLVIYLQCMQRVHKLCRCGKKEREVTCGTEFLCEAKCSNMRQCERHPCKRKVLVPLTVTTSSLTSTHPFSAVMVSVHLVNKRVDEH